MFVGVCFEIRHAHHCFSLKFFNRICHHSLKAQKDKLDTIQSVQGASLDELENQLKESQRIYGKMKQNLQGEILQNLISGEHSVAYSSAASLLELPILSNFQYCCMHVDFKTLATTLLLGLKTLQLS